MGPGLMAMLFGTLELSLQHSSVNPEGCGLALQTFFASNWAWIIFGSFSGFLVRNFVALRVSGKLFQRQNVANILYSVGKKRVVSLDLRASFRNAAWVEFGSGVYWCLKFVDRGSN